MHIGIQKSLPPKNTMADSSIAKPLRVAIVGGGPAGLGAAIALSKHPFVEVVLYEKKPEISEIGNGLSIQRNTWRMLERLGASRHITANEVFRPRDGHVVQHRYLLTPLFPV